jgi:hypothetical protein
MLVAEFLSKKYAKNPSEKILREFKFMEKLPVGGAKPI